MSQFHFENTTSYNALALMAVVPEFSNIALLIAVIYGMYHGIEVGHPIYAVLFLNLVVPVLATLIEIGLYFALSSELYLTIASGFGGSCLTFHSNSWCITSAMRYTYIAYESWVHSKIPSMKIQSILACSLTIFIVCSTQGTIFTIAVSLGKLINDFITISTKQLNIATNFSIFKLTLKHNS